MVSVALASAIAIGTLMIVTILVTLMTGSVLAAGVVVALIAIAYTVLVYYGFLNVKVSGNQVDISLWDVVDAVTPKPMPLAPLTTPAPIRGKEVYYVGDNRFTYDEAPAVCAAYGADLASQDQVESAFADGAEWCGYGWSAGGVALFPTQRATWELLQKEVDTTKRTACGRPGVNGGYFDPSLKFGVNCYGVKPDGTATLPQPPPGTDMKSFNERVARFKAQIKDFFMAPFNRNIWADANPTIAGYGSQFSQNIGGLAGSVGGTMPAMSTFSAGTSVGAPISSQSSANAPVSSPASTAAPATTGSVSLQTVISGYTAYWNGKITNGCMKIAQKPANFSGNDGMPIDDTYVLLKVNPTSQSAQCKIDPSDPALVAVETYMKSNPQTNPVTDIIKPAMKALLQLAPLPPAVPAYSGSKTYTIGESVSFNGSTYRMVEGAGAPGYAPDRPGDRLWQKV